VIGIFGILIVFAMVFGGYLAAGGKMKIILAALPFEMMIIGGAAVGAFLLANDFHGVKSTGRAILQVFRGKKWTEADYTDLLCLLYELIRQFRSDPVAMEAHIEDPAASEIFGRYPKIQSDREACELICDTLRSATLNYDDPHQVEEVLEKRLEESIQHKLHPSHALQIIADGLPALGIVAAVLGVIKTMGAIDQPPEVLGKLIGSALVGTFLGVFLAYGFVGPMAERVRQIVQEDSHFYQLIAEVLVANLHKHPPNICLEVGRQNAPMSLRPNYEDLEDAIKQLKRDAA